MNKEIGYIPSLNGVRALAVLLVFFSHTGFSHIVPGGLGVTIFFFLSGYLITTLLVDEQKKTGSISLKNFYIRRIYRLFPPLYIVIIATILITIVKGDISYINIGGFLSQILHYSNYYIIFVGKEGMIPGLGILWSLAVEEHFYLFFPLFLLFFIKKISTKNLVFLIVLIILAVNAWRLILVLNFDILSLRDQLYHYTYYATDTRFDSLLYGCVMALILNPIHMTKKVNNNSLLIKVGMLLGTTLILFTLLYRDIIFRETIRYSIQGIAMFPIFYYLITQNKSLLYKLFNSQFMSFIGKISYSFYLSHYVLIYLAQSLFGDTLLVKNIIGLLFTLLFSTFMYYFVEKRFALLRKKLH
ncbi:acyltransferase family protein [Colwellia sp. Bg11-28]|uniref:acyltransferase family protein n=1 Tax=Colwellia sp. Bg11-28 TaxID=2058305 RepID=UPI000C347336|nr:acyltransferase [Colwellia sp. Bg11-28]PKH85164.1 acyltransferase [Colwellia sp. Bg11-28]